MKVLFVVPYSEGQAASQRFRVEQLLPLLKEKGIKYKIAPFWSGSTWSILYRQGHFLQKTLGLMQGFWRRGLLLFQLPFYTYVFIHREATPVGAPWFEGMAAKVFRKKIIFDFDDAIWLPNTTAGNSIAARYKQHGKIAPICRWSHKVSCGNRYLLQFALKHNTNAVLLPTVIDTAHYHNQLKAQHTKQVTIGWTGSHSTLPFLKQLEPVLQQLEQQYNFRVLVIADQAPEISIRSLVYKPWRKETEIEDLLQFNIGVMPLPDTEWAKGKCAFKALQYMALGIPAVVSSVGANTEAVPDGVAGYTCSSQQEWYNRLEQLLLDAGLRSEMGAAGREWVQERYSVQAHQEAFLSLFA
mgnify:CR=1 FL=1